MNPLIDLHLNPNKKNPCRTDAHPNVCTSLAAYDNGSFAQLIRFIHIKTYVPSYVASVRTNVNDSPLFFATCLTPHKIV